jgi:single-stranded-DNA-specific exonuclease
MATAQQLGDAGPWGQEFPEPLFDGRFNLIGQRKVGENHLKMVLSPLEENQYAIDAIAFNVEAVDWPAQSATEIEIAYRMDINEFRGNMTLQLMVEKILSYS